MKSLGNFLLSFLFVTFVYYNLLIYILKLGGIDSSLEYYFGLQVISMVYLIQSGKLKTIYWKKIISLFFLMFYITLTLLYSSNEESLTKFYVIILRTILPVSIIVLYQESGYKINIKTIYIFSFIYASIIFINAFEGSFLLRTGLIKEVTRSSRTIIGVIEDSRSLVISILIVLLFSNARTSKYLIILYLVLALILTQTRQSILALIIVAIPYFMYTSRKTRKYRKLIFRFILLIGLILIIAYNYKPIYQKVSQVDRFNILTSNSLQTQLEDTRVGLYIFALNEFKNAPVFGNGLAHTDFKFTYPHNVILEILAEFGIIGLLLFGVIFIYGWNRNKDNRVRTLILFAFTVSLFSGNIAQNYFLFAFLFIDMNKILYDKKTNEFTNKWIKE